MDMLHKQGSPKNVADRETRYLAEPAILTTIILCCSLIGYGIGAVRAGSLDFFPLLLGIAGVIYAIALYRIIIKTPDLLQKWKWPTTIIDAACIATGLIFIPSQFHIIPQIIGILIAGSIVILWDRFTSCTFLILALVLHFLFAFGLSFDVSTFWLNDFTLLLLGLIIVETLHRSGQAAQHRIQRLESINEFARKIVYSLETDDVLNLVGAAIQDAIPADTYFLGMTHDSKTIHFDLIFDDGEYFPPSTAPIEGTLSGWVIRNRRSLFIPDMRQNVDPDGVQTITIGKSRNSLSWMGVPLHADHINGVISVGSYTANNFDRTDFDLLENLAQQATLALDNAFHHAEIKSQSMTDSLTGVYNHNHIMDILQREAENNQSETTPFSLIMLDVDHFKRYNDVYGHMIGDQVLTMLTQTIRTHIHDSDAVGRWGGEEFVVVLPKTTGPQAFVVAERIQDAMRHLTLQGRNGESIPAPTVSQGIAVFPTETREINQLIDLADQRLYLAKERGRNQVEPGEEHWSI